MSEKPKKLGFLDKARLAISNAIKPKAYQGSFESTRMSVGRTRVDAPSPTDFKQEFNESVRKEMVRLSRYLHKNNGLLRQMVSDTAIYAVGDGINMQANGGDFDWQSLIESEWEQESISPEVTGRFSLLESLYIICKALDIDGEIFAIKCKRNGIPKYQIIECHRVETPPNLLNDTSVSDGIRFNKFGVPTAYYVKQNDGSYSTIPASSMMHIYEATHASASRAYPPHQHSINNLRDEMDLLSMEKTAAKDNSRISRILKTNDTNMDGDISLGSPINSPPQSQQTNTDSLNRVLGGVTAVLLPNEELVSHQSARPTTAFTGFIEHLRRDSVMGSVPYEFLADPTKVGGGAVRLVVAKASRYFSHRQNIIISRFLNPYFQYWLGTKIARGDLPSAKNWWKVDWMTTRSVTVDAGRDAVNERADLEMGRVTPEDDFAGRGLQFEKTMRKRAKNFLFIEKLAQEVGIDRNDLFRFSPDGKNAPQMPQQGQQVPDGQQYVDENGNPVKLEDGVEYVIEEPEITDKVGESLVETTPPDVSKDGINPIEDLNKSVDLLPKQNNGLSRPLQ